MKKSLAAVLCFGLVLACSKKEESTENSVPPILTPSIPTHPSQVVAQAQNCEGGSLVKSITEKPWSRDQMDGAVRLHQTLMIKQYTITNRLRCIFGDSMVTSQVTTHSKLVGDTVQIINPVRDRGVQLMVNGQPYLCEASLDPALSFAYQIRGNCLTISVGAELITFTAGH